MQSSNLIFAAALALSLAACDKRDDAKSSTTEAATQQAAEGNAAAPAEVAAAAKLFDKDQRKRACEMMPAAMVATALGVAEADLKQMEIGGCIYTYQGSDEHKDMEASLMSVWINEDAAAGRTHFDNATQDRSAEQLRGQLGAVTKQAKQQDSIDTELEEKTVDQVGGLMAATIPDAGHHYEDVEGLGDAARVLTYDATVTVLVGNMVFNVRAYAGEQAPKPEMPATPNIDAIMAAAMKAEVAWLDKTREQRKQQSIALAKAVVAAL